MSTWNVLVVVIYSNYHWSKMYTKTKSTVQIVNQAKDLSIADIVYIFFKYLYKRYLIIISKISRKYFEDDEM